MGSWGYNFFYPSLCSHTMLAHHDARSWRVSDSKQILPIRYSAMHPGETPCPFVATIAKIVEKSLILYFSDSIHAFLLLPPFFPLDSVPVASLPVAVAAASASSISGV